MSQDILRVSFPTELMTWIENNAHNYEVTAEEYLIILIKSEMRRGNEIAKNGKTNCNCGREKWPGEFDKEM